jgi:hypothetical protein
MVMHADTVVEMLGAVLGADGAAVVVDSGFGSTAQLPAGPGGRVGAAGDWITLAGPADAWRLRVHRQTVQSAAFAEEPAEPGAAGDGGSQEYAFRLLNRGGEDLLRAALPPAAWRELRDRYAGTPDVRSIVVTRAGPPGPASPDLLLRCLADLRDSDRVVFLLECGIASTEVFPNVPLRDPKLENGYLLLGEPFREDVHLHLEVAHTTHLRFAEDRRADGAVRYTVNFLDWAGRAKLIGNLAPSYRRRDGTRVEADPDREQVFRDLYRRYADHPGVQLAVGEPLRVREPAPAS